MKQELEKNTETRAGFPMVLRQLIVIGAVLVVACGKGTPEPSWNTSGTEVEGRLDLSTRMEIAGSDLEDVATAMSQRRDAWALQAGNVSYDLIFTEKTTLDDKGLEVESAVTVQGAGDGGELRLLPRAVYRAWGQVEDAPLVWFSATQGSIQAKTMTVNHLEYVGPPVADTAEMLLVAIYERSPDQAEEALRQGADVHGTTWPNPPLHMAVEKGGPAVVSVLLEHGADVNGENDGTTPLHVALKSSDPDLQVIEVLLRYGANVRAENRRGETPLDLARDCPECLALLGKHAGPTKP